MPQQTVPQQTAPQQTAPQQTVPQQTVPQPTPYDSTSPTATSPSPTPPTPPAAILWDMDGTLVDTEPYWMLAQSELMESWGAVWTAADQESVIGMGLWEVADTFKSRGVGLTTDEIVGWLSDRVIERTRVSAPWRPGARELLEQIRDAGIPTALVTMSIHQLADDIAASVGFSAFDAVVAGEDVEFSKPHPAPYLQAAALLGVEITECVALEDSIPGVASAIASGAITIGLPLHTAVPDQDDLVLWDGLEGKRLAHVIEVFASRRASNAQPAESPTDDGSRS